MSDVFDVLDYQNEVRRKEEAAAYAAREQNNRAVWNTLCDHWDVSDHQANYQIVRDFCNGDMTVEKFQVMLDSGQGADLEWKGTRDKIIGEIAELLEGKGERHSYDNTRAIASMRFWPKAKLRARLAELKFRQGKTLNDARTLLDQHRAAERNPYAPFEKMPDSITAQVIREALNTQAGRDRYRVWNRRYGHTQVEARRLS
jgi:hypothetical protein